jgi:hypothetical protein
MKSRNTEEAVLFSTHIARLSITDHSHSDNKLVFSPLGITPRLYALGIWQANLIAVESCPTLKSNLTDREAPLPIYCRQAPSYHDH